MTADELAAKVAWLLLGESEINDADAAGTVVTVKGPANNEGFDRFEITVTDRRPGVQNPADDPKWATFEQAIEDALKSGRWRGFDGPDGASKDEVIDDVAEALAELRGQGYPKEPFERLSAGVQSPPATPEPEPLGYLRVKDRVVQSYAIYDRELIEESVRREGGEIVAVVPVPVPDPETETTDG